MSVASEARLAIPTFGIGDILIRKIEDGPPIAVKGSELFADGDWRSSLHDADWIASDQHRVANGDLLLAFNSYLLTLHGKNLLIDTGIGNGKDRSDYPDYAYRRTDFLARLAACGLSERDIDYVVCTHLHADHVGWNTQWSGAAWEPTFPRATYVFSRTEHDMLAARWSRGERDSWALAAYEDSIAPILRRGQAAFWTPESELLPGVRFHGASGHSPDQFYVGVTSAGESAVFSADIFHHVVQIACPALVPVYDQDKAAAQAVRQRLFDDLANGTAVMFPAHFCGVSAGRIRRKREGGCFEFLQSTEADQESQNGQR